MSCSPAGSPAQSCLRGHAYRRSVELGFYLVRLVTVCTRTCLQTLVDVVDCVLPFASIVSKGAVVCVGLGLWDEIQNVSKIVIPQEKAEYAAMGCACND